jgi:hypothetical protein
MCQQVEMLSRYAKTLIATFFMTEQFFQTGWNNLIRKIPQSM